MYAVDCYFTTFSIRHKMPETTYLCKDQNEVEICKKDMEEAGVLKIEVVKSDESNGQSPIEWNLWGK